VNLNNPKIPDDLWSIKIGKRKEAEIPLSTKDINCSRYPL